MTNAATNITTLDFDKITAFPNNRIRISENDRHFDIEQEFARLMESGSGRKREAKRLIEFCENWSQRILKLFLVEDDFEAVCELLAEQLQCDTKQAHCLIELTLELIHVKIHGKLRQGSNVDLSYMIKMATSALQRQ